MYKMSMVWMLLFVYFFVKGQNYSEDSLNAEKLYRVALKNYIHSEYDSSLCYFEIAANQFKDLKLTHRYLHALIYTANTYRAKGSFTETLNILEKVGNYKGVDIKNYPLLEAEFLYVKGTTLGDMGRNQQGIYLLNKSVELRLAINGSEDSLLAYPYNNMGNNYYYLGNLDKALEYYEKALDVATNSKKSIIDPDIALYYQNIGIIYAMRGDFDKALQYFTENLYINRELYGASNPNLALIYLNLGRMKYTLKQLDEAMEYFDMAESLFKEYFGPDYHNLGTLYLNKGNIYNDRKDFEKAYEYYRKAQRVYAANLQHTHPNRYKVINNIASILLKRKEYSAALENYKQSYMATKDPVSKTLIARNLGQIFHDLKDSVNAAYYYELSLKNALNELVSNHYELGHTYLAYGKFCFENNKPDKAFGYFKRAYHIFLENFGFKNPNVSDALTSIGDYYFKTKQYYSALDSYQQALICNAYGFNDTNPYINPDIDSVIIIYQLVEPLLGKANTFRELSKGTFENKVENLRTALQCCDIAINIVDVVRSHIREESKLHLSGDVDKVYENAVKISNELYKLTGQDKYLRKSFEFSEKSRFAVMLASLRDIEAIAFGGIPDSLQQLEKKIKEDIAIHEKWIYDEKQELSQDQNKISNWESRLFQLNRQHDSLIKTFEEDYRKYFNLKYDNEIASLKEIQSELASDQVMIEYFLADTMLFIFTVKPDELVLRTNIMDTSHNTKLTHLRKYYQNSILDHSKEVYWNYIKLSHYFYQTLIFPVKDLIKEKRLIIVPDGRLGYIPFETLLADVPPRGKLDYRNLNYLIRNNPVSYSYSATIHFNNPKKKALNEELLAVAPSYEKYGIHTNSNGQDTNGLRIGPIFHSNYEVSGISSIFPGKVLKDINATEQRFKSIANQYSILHMAMHALIDDNNPMFSKLIFTPSVEENQEDGFMHTYELYKMKLNAELAVLSACNTGSGKLREGEGIINLARGFTYAGVPSIIMTLWEVEDKSGAEIMLNFYDYLNKGYSKDRALQQAKLDYLKNMPQFRAHPYFWSAYVNIGDTVPIKPGQWNLLKITLVFILTVGIISMTIYLRRNQKRKK